MNPLRHQPQQKLRTLAVLCGSMAVLMGFAVFLSGTSGTGVLANNTIAPQSQTASLFGGCGFLGAGSCADSNSSINFTALSSPSYGQTSTLQWNLNGPYNYYSPITCALSGGRYGGGTVVTHGVTLSSGGRGGMYIKQISSDGTAGTDPIYGPITYTLHCTITNARTGSQNDIGTATVTLVPALPSGKITALPAMIILDGSNLQKATLTWSTGSATSCAISGPGVSASDNGGNCSSGAAHSTQTSAFTTPGTYGPYTVSYYTSGTGWVAASTVYVSVKAAPVPTCANGTTGSSGSCVSCNVGFSLVSGACVADSPAQSQTPTPQCAGAHQVNYPSCSCDIGYSMQNGSCAAVTCSDPHAVAPLCSSCQSGYSMLGGACVNVPQVSLSAAQSRVQNGKPASLSWSVGGLVAGGAATCSVSSNPAGVFAATMPANTAPSWSGSNQTTAALTSTTIFTLSCTNAAPVSVTVGLIPAVKEL